VKTLFLTQDYPPDTGGIARLYGELCRRFPPGGVEVSTVALPRDRGVEPGGAFEGSGSAGSGPLREFAAASPPVHRLPFTFREARRLSSVARWTRWTGRRLAAGDVAVLQVGNIRPAGYVAAWLRGRTGVPYVIYVHGKDLWKEEGKTSRSAMSRRTARWVLGGAAALVANSRPTARFAEALLRSIGVDPAGRVRVVHPGTDPVRFRPDSPGAAEWRRELGLEGRRVLLSVSRLMRRKGIDTALEALAELAPRYPDVAYVVGGEGPDRERLERLAGELGVAERVRFVGAVAEARLPGLYAAADLFVLPVREERSDDEVEGFGIVFCEAAATGVPVVAGASGGVADAVRDGETGLLVPPRDAGATAAAIARLLDDEPLRRRLGGGGRRAVEAYYHWDRAAAEAWAILEEVAAARPREARR
jgi:phosphatidylinositol alpha-1,6-mannosyltransferase